jgi:tripartite-type tricarboxylate transporter receptor subunit TctC
VKNKTSLRLSVAVLLASTVVAASGALPAAAQDAAAGPFAGKQFRLIIPHTAGRGLDSYARMIAPYIVEHAGASGISIENLVGAAGVVGNNEMWSSEPDGLTFSFTALASVVLADLSGSEGVEYQAAEITYLARSSAQPRLFLVGENSEITSAEDLKTLGRPFIYPVIGADEDFYTMNVFADAIGMEMTLVTGYEGSADSNLSVFSGDTDGLLLAATQAAPIIAEGDFVPLMSFTSERLPAYPDLPTPAELAGADNAELNAMVTVLEMDRGFIGPPGMDPATAEALRALMDEVHNDPDLIAQAEAAGLPIIYLNGAELQANVEAIVEASDTLTPALQGALLRLE